MRIGIDAHIIGKQKGGVETFLANSVQTLAQFDRVNDYIVYVSPGCAWLQRSWPENFRIRKLPTANPWLERLLVLPRIYKLDKLDVIYVQRALPLWGCERSVVHMHDALYWTHANLFSPLRRAILNPIFRRSGRRATKIITPSLASREEIIRCYGVSAKKIVVVPNGVDLAFYRPAENPEVLASSLRRFGVSTPYLIFVGAIERTKNVHGLLGAYAQFRQRHPEFQLVIGGNWRQETAQGYQEQINSLLQKYSLERFVKFTGYLPPDDYRDLLSGAQMLIFPSFGEGFGLPPLEAMACGVPVITSNIPVFRELYTEAALMTDPADTGQLAELMIRLAEDRGLAGDLIAKGLETAQRFSWSATGNRLLDVLRSAAGPVD